MKHNIARDHCHQRIKCNIESKTIGKVNWVLQEFAGFGFWHVLGSDEIFHNPTLI